MFRQSISVILEISKKNCLIDNINLKTGTLTEMDIDLAGAIQRAEFQKPVLQLSKLPDTHQILKVTTTCHTLIKVSDQLNGYSIDRKMFDTAKWKFANGPAGVNSDYGIEKILSCSVHH